MSHSTDWQPGGAAPADSSTGELVSRLSQEVSELVRNELKLAQVEVSGKAKKAGVGVGGHLVDDPLHDRIEELLAAGHVAVERHRRDSEDRTEASHGETGQALLVDELDRRVDHPVPTEGHPGRGRRLTTDDGGIAVHVCWAAGRLEPVGHGPIVRRRPLAGGADLPQKVGAEGACHRDRPGTVLLSFTT